MSGKSPNFLPSPRFSNETPPRNQQFNYRQPLYLPPNSPFMSPRTNRLLSPGNRPSGGSPDFVPLGISSPVNSVNRARHSWSRGNYSNNSSYSTYSTPSSPSSFNSSHGYSPYKRHGSRGNFRGRGGHNYSGSSGSSSPPIHLYCDKEALEDPWAELAEKLEKGQSLGERRDATDTEIALNESSASDVSDDGDDS